MIIDEIPIIIGTIWQLKIKNNHIKDILNRGLGLRFVNPPIKKGVKKKK